MLRTWGWFLAGLVLIVAGSFLAHQVQTSGGRVEVRDVRFAGDGGIAQSGLLYIPRGATAATPKPAVLLSHGYINTREMQSPFAIELSRRGFVVLAADSTGHGYSGGTVLTPGMGGPAALRYLQAQPFVDRANIGLEGHSMGGTFAFAAALSQPDGYRSIVLEGSTPGLLGAPAPENPRNLAVVYGQYDEFAELMYAVPKGSQVADSAKLMKLFGITAPAVEGHIYGSLADGTARVFYNPPITHPWEHFSRAGVQPAVVWLERTLDGEAGGIPPQDQVWLWKEIGTGAAFAGFCLLLLGAFQGLLTVGKFRALNVPAEPVAARRDGRWWLAFALTALVPAATFFLFMKLGQVFFPMRLFPQWIQNQLLVWALANALIAWGLSRLLRTPKPRFVNRWGLSAGIAIATVAVGYVALAVVDAVWKVDFRFWVIGLKPLDAAHAVTMLPYLVLWAAAFLVTSRALVSSLPVRGESELAGLSAGKLAMSLGFVALLAVQYGALFSTGRMAVPSEPLNTIIAIQFVALLSLVGAIAIFTYRRTSSYVPGALICALVIGWYVTAGTATHWSPDFRLPPMGAAAKR
ncbi:alpha/beta hydrolase [Phenylobacterium sp. J367]|uniref:alpha/beta hydrolase n=1 Tax=Phenylobacterium sp. J367 TaxID=2898435 RepID=UPI002151AE34|nr:alpha/beta fold hydrolase [Phenylobacterium sp. J367]MCR5878983.1 alpha/beta fold hydrolase [Phenylobacterium sp. J367]